MKIIDHNIMMKFIRNLILSLLFQSKFVYNVVELKLGFNFIFLN